MFTKNIKINEDIYGIKLDYIKGSYSVEVYKNSEYLEEKQVYSELEIVDKPREFSFSSLLDANWCFLTLINFLEAKSQFRSCVC